MRPNTWGCVIDSFPRTFGYGALPASSRHPVGVNVLFADGSTRFVKSTVSDVVWWALGTKAGKEVVSQDGY
jgi:prepilin-type processing-associated H-X9-DG protein